MDSSFFVAFSPNGHWLASGSENGIELRHEDASEQKITLELPNAAYGSFSPDSSTLLIKLTNGDLYTVEQFDVKPVLKYLHSLQDEGAAPIYTKCGSFIIDGSWDGGLHLIDSKSRDRVFFRKFPEMITGIFGSKEMDEWYVHHSPIATTDDEPPQADFFTIWSLPVLENFTRILKPNMRFVATCTISRSGNHIAVIHGAPPENISIIDSKSGKQLGTRKIAFGGTSSRLAWSSKGLLAIVEQDCVRLYSESLELKAEYELEFACDIAFTPDGQTLAIGSWETGQVISLERLLQ